MEPDEIHESIETLFDQWASRSNYLALKHLLNGWPLSSGLTDDWANLLEELQFISDSYGGSLTEEERRILLMLITEINQRLFHR